MKKKEYILPPIIFSLIVIIGLIINYEAEKFVHDHFSNNEEYVTQEKYDKLVDQVEFLVEAINKPNQEDSIYSDGIMVRIDEKGNKILLVNPKGNIEVFCEGFYINGERIDSGE